MGGYSEQDMENVFPLNCYFRWIFSNTSPCKKDSLWYNVVEFSVRIHSFVPTLVKTPTELSFLYCSNI